MPKKRRPEYERELRLELMGQVKKACDENGLTLPPVEGLWGLTTGVNRDGSHLISS